MTSKASSAVASTKATAIEVSDDMRDEANSRRFDDSLLRALDTVEAVEAFLAANDIALESIDDYGSGFGVLDNKDTLIAQPFMIIGWSFRESKEYGSPFVVAFVMTKAGERHLVVDGSTGICKQLREITDERISRGKPNAQQGLAVPRGLKRSDYEVENPKDPSKTISASTYYLA